MFLRSLKKFKLVILLLLPGFNRGRYIDFVNQSYLTCQASQTLGTFLITAPWYNFLGKIGFSWNRAFTDVLGLNIERLYAIKRPFDYRASLLKHRYVDISTLPIEKKVIHFLFSVGPERSLFVGVLLFFLLFLWCSARPSGTTGKAKRTASASFRLMMWVPCRVFQKMAKRSFGHKNHFPHIITVTFLFLILPESLGVLGVHNELPNSNSANLAHLGTHGAPLYHQSSKWPNQQVTTKNNLFDF